MDIQSVKSTRHNDVHVFPRQPRLAILSLFTPVGLNALYVKQLVLHAGPNHPDIFHIMRSLVSPASHSHFKPHYPLLPLDTRQIYLLSSRQIRRQSLRLRNSTGASGSGNRLHKAGFYYRPRFNPFIQAMGYNFSVRIMITRSKRCLRNFQRPDIIQTWWTPLQRLPYRKRTISLIRATRICILYAAAKYTRTIPTTPSYSNPTISAMSRKRRLDRSILVQTDYLMMRHVLSSTHAAPVSILTFLNFLSLLEDLQNSAPGVRQWYFSLALHRQQRLLPLLLPLRYAATQMRKLLLQMLNELDKPY